MPSGPPASSKPSAYILIIDAYDEAEMYAVNFRHNGFDVTTAATAVEGLTSIDVRSPDLVIQGLVFSDLPGLELARRLKARLRAVPIAAISGFTDAASLESISAEGFSLVVTKPCLPDDLLRQVGRLIGRPPDRRPRWSRSGRA